jgi:hypothetical protein
MTPVELVLALFPYPSGIAVLAVAAVLLFLWLA